MRHFLQALLLLSGLLTATQGFAAELTEADYAAANARLIDDYLLPRYQTLQARARALDEAAAEHCTAPGGTAAKPLRAAYAALADQWARVEHLHFEPAELLMRRYRFHFWPQSRGRLRQPLEELLREGANEPEVFEADSFRFASVAVQGLPALEWLLYDTHSPLPDAPARACPMARAVTANLKQIAEGLRGDWQGGQLDFAATLREPASDNIYAPSHREVSLAFFQSLHDGLQLAVDIKLEPQLGETLEQARPELAEAWRSGRSLANLIANLESLQAHYAVGFGPLVRARDEALDALMRKAFRMTLESARAVEPPLSQALERPEARAGLETLQTRLLALKQIVRTRLAEALDLRVGFNALDGD